MKITYPECQIEISVDEVIALDKHFENTKPEIHISHPTEFSTRLAKVVESLPKFDGEFFKRIHLSNLRRMEEEERKRVHDLFDETDLNLRGDGILPLIKENPLPKFDPDQEREDDPLAGVSFDDPEHQPAPVPYPKEEETAPLESTKEVKKKKSSGKMKKVDILFDTGWKTFGSLTAAAKAIDARLNHLSHALMTGKTCNGHHVRYSNPELDAALAEIEANNKKPYEPSKRP